KLSTLWRIVSQVNVDEIREDVVRPFHLLVVAEDESDASTLAAHLSDGDAAFIHPWITAATPDAVDVAQAQAHIDFALVLTPSVELTAPMQETYRRLTALRVPVLIVVTGSAAATPGAALSRRGEEKRVLAPEFNAATVRKQIPEAIVALALPSLRLALAHRLPPLRPAAFQQLIQETAQVNATYAFSTGIAEVIPGLGIPLNVSDLIVLTKNQLVMAYKIAVMAGKQGSPQHLLGEIMGVLGGGFLFRQLARELVGLIPVWGIAPKVAVSYAGTWAIGEAVVLWAVEGRKITPDLLRQFFDDALARGQAVAQRLTGDLRKRLPKPSDQAPHDQPAKAVEAEPLWKRLQRRLPLRRSSK
ncbi:MAG: hypothetical protein KDD84_01065, partial [Caldilineaceae bacterium]|nr:hypothetical protein [Caldilineaceae bacterium]